MDLKHLDDLYSNVNDSDHNYVYSNDFEECQLTRDKNDITQYILDVDVNKFFTSTPNNKLKMLHINCQSLSKNFDELTTLLSSVKEKLSVIFVSETWLNTLNENNYQIEGYHFFSNCRKGKLGGGVGFYVDDNLECSINSKLNRGNVSVECLFLEIKEFFFRSSLFGVLYRPPNSDIKLFNSKLVDLLGTIDSENYHISCIAGDFNIDLLKCDSNNNYKLFYDNMLAYSFLPSITKPTRVSINTLLIIFS
jgi:hypothetical protein